MHWAIGSREGRRSVRSKARFVDPIIDIVIGPLICIFNLCPEFLRKEVYALILVGDYVIEFCIEHADDFAGLIVEMISSFIFLSMRFVDVPHC